MPGRFISFNHAIITCSYLSLLIWQLVWHTLLPAPAGAGILWLGPLAVIPLLLPLKGIIRGSIRSMTWGGYLLMLYLVIGLMEAWSNAPQRIPALIQTALVVFCIYGLVAFSRETR